MRENYEHISEDKARLTATVEENVLVQLEHLRTHPSVAAALARKELTIHGWVYKFETGQVFTYRPEDEQYAAIEGALTPSSGGGFPTI
jgi:carbonic anhydrase